MDMKKNYGKVGFYVIVLFIFGWFIPEIYDSLQKIYNSFEISTDVSGINSRATISGAQNEHEIALIYIGCSSCGPSNIEALPPAYSKIRDSLAIKARQHGYSFKTIGISKDRIVKEEIAHLAKYGPFDEISIGNNWANSGLLRYVHRMAGPLANPQLLVTARKFRPISSSRRTVYRGIDYEELLVRKVGSQSILDFAEEGVPLPPNSFEITDEIME